MRREEGQGLGTPAMHGGGAPSASGDTLGTPAGMPQGAGMGRPLPEVALAPETSKPAWVKNTGQKEIRVEGLILKSGEVGQVPSQRALDAALKHESVESATFEEAIKQEAAPKFKVKVPDEPFSVPEEPIPVV